MSAAHSNSQEVLEGELVEDDESESPPDSELVLVFTAEGQCILEEDGEAVWMSDDDDDFAENFGDDFLDADHDAADVLNYLLDEGLIDEEERATVAIDTEVEADGASDDKDNE